MNRPLHLLKKSFSKRTAMLSLACLLGIFACKETDNVAPVNTIEPEINSLFNFKTTQEVNFTISAKDAEGTSLNLTNIQIYDKDPQEGGELLLEGGIDNAGKLSAFKAIPSYLTEVTIVSNFPGVLDKVVVPVTDETVIYTFDVAAQADTGGRLSTDANARISAGPYTVLGTFNSQGVPNYLRPVNDVVSASFLNAVNKALPNGKKVNPAYLAPGVSYDLKIAKASNVTITFVSEDASYKNSLGYYTYPLNNAPTSVAAINEKFIVFPNVSFKNSGGGLYAGNKVKLPATIPAGTGIGFFIVSDGWTGSGISSSNDILFSNPAFNTGLSTNKKQHSVLLKYQDKCILAFEDIKRDLKESDEDFNDVLFYVTTDPIGGIDDGDIPPCEPIKDCDKDGVPDETDKYSCDPIRAYDNITKGTLAFEDQWPKKGDFDLNDLVINYTHNTVTNSQNKVVELKSTFDIVAIGANYKNGFGFELSKLSPSQIATITSSHGGTKLEDGQTKATILVFDNAFDFAPSGSTALVNTQMAQPKVVCGSITITTTFASTLTMQELGTAPFNPFMISKQRRGYEVHLPGYLPTSKADLTVLGTEDDASLPANGKYYKTAHGMPFALHLPINTFKYPVENTSITEAYLKFVPWAVSNGIIYSNWYLDVPGYRNTSKIYTK